MPATASDIASGHPLSRLLAAAAPKGRRRDRSAPVSKLSSLQMCFITFAEVSEFGIATQVVLALAARFNNFGGWLCRLAEASAKLWLLVCYLGFFWRP